MAPVKARRALCIVIASAAPLCFTACTSNRETPADLSTEASIAACPATPNCVSSDAGGGLHGIEPLVIDGDPQALWAALVELLESDPAFRIIEHSDRFLMAEARTAVFRFVDDVTFELRPAAGVIAMRSASRVGIGDFGANRRRLEKIRKALLEK